MPTLYGHLDESGNLDFTETGTRYYVFAATWTSDPRPLADKLTTLRFALLKVGHNVEAFHATEDKQENRDQVVEAMASIPRWRYVAVVIEKAKVNPSITEPHAFYPKFATIPLKFIFRGVVKPQTDIDRVMLFTDSLPIKRHRMAVEKAIKISCGQELPNNIHFLVYHHHRNSNTWLQATDYCSWAIFRKWEAQDSRTYDQLRDRLERPELDVMNRGAVTYYRHPKEPSN